MWKYIFSGIVQPERALIDMPGSFPLDIKHKDVDIAGRAIVCIFKSQITVDFTSAQAVSEWLTLKNIITDLVAAIVNCAGLDGVVGYNIDIRSMVSVHDQETIVFGVDIPGLSIQNDEQRKIDILQTFKVVGQEPLLRLALSDFKDAIIYPNNTGLFCYRATESIINLVKKEKNITDKKVAIQELEKLLTIDEACIKFLRSLNVNVRHGQVEWISGQDRLTAIKITREIITRYIAYQNSKPNIAPTFDLLKR